MRLNVSLRHYTVKAPLMFLWWRQGALAKLSGRHTWRRPCDAHFDRIHVFKTSCYTRLPSSSLCQRWMGWFPFWPGQTAHPDGFQVIMPSNSAVCTSHISRGTIHPQNPRTFSATWSSYLKFLMLCTCVKLFIATSSVRMSFMLMGSLLWLILSRPWMSMNLWTWGIRSIVRRWRCATVPIPTIVRQKCWSSRRAVANMAGMFYMDIVEMFMVRASSWLSCCWRWMRRPGSLITVGVAVAIALLCGKNSVKHWKGVAAICKRHWMVCESTASLRGPSFTSTFALQWFVCPLSLCIAVDFAGQTLGLIHPIMLVYIFAYFGRCPVLSINSAWYEATCLETEWSANMISMFKGFVLP